MDELKRNLQLQGPESVSGAVPEDVAQLQDSENESPYFGKEQTAQDEEQQKLYDAAQQLKNPNAVAISAKELADKLAIASAPAKAAGEGALAVEKEKNKGVLDEKAAQNEATMRLLGMATAGRGGGNESGLAGPGGTIKPTINANGGVSFTTTQMPALVQRAHSQLSEAHGQHLEALQEAERLWPGINDAAENADKGTAPGLGNSVARWFGGATGLGAEKYAGPSDAAALASETYRYRARQPTPLSNFIQKASFGNLEQMAGQLPGVRGLATIVPLFREHQAALTSNNPGTPLATVQRLRHLINSEESALTEMTHQPGEE